MAIWFIALSVSSIYPKIGRFNMSNSAYLRRDQPVANEEFDVHNSNKTEDNVGDGGMTTPSREEIQALLAANKAEVGVVAAEMRREMAEFRTFQTQQFSGISSSISDLRVEFSNVRGEFSGLKGEITALRGEVSGNKDAVSGQIDGLKTSISTMQWMVGTVLAMIGIAVAILAIPGIDKLL